MIRIVAAMKRATEGGSFMSNIKMHFKMEGFYCLSYRGDPNADKTVEYILEMEKAGADLNWKSAFPFPIRRRRAW